MDSTDDGTVNNVAAPPCNALQVLDPNTGLCVLLPPILNYEQAPDFTFKAVLGSEQHHPRWCAHQQIHPWGSARKL